MTLKLNPPTLVQEQAKPLPNMNTHKPMPVTDQAEQEWSHDAVQADATLDDHLQGQADQMTQGDESAGPEDHQPGLDNQ